MSKFDSSTSVSTRESARAERSEIHVPDSHSQAQTHPGICQSPAPEDVDVSDSQLDLPSHTQPGKSQSAECVSVDVSHSPESSLHTQPVQSHGAKENAKADIEVKQQPPDLGVVGTVLESESGGSLPLAGPNPKCTSDESTCTQTLSQKWLRWCQLLLHQINCSSLTCTALITRESQS
jgi:hypothetical protein